MAIMVRRLQRLPPTEKELMALEWLFRMAAHSAHIEYAMVIQDMLIDRGVQVDVRDRAPLRDGWPT